MQKILKSAIDLTCSLAALIVAIPLFALIALAIKVDSEGSVFFTQDRVGYRGKLFRIYKFRTMVVDADKKGAGVFVEENDSRITKVGRLLRYTSLDELPQLINIVKGEMSLIGPRPTLPYQVEKYNARQRKRLDVKPGITGWAQINGRNSLTWPQRIELDLWYIANWSLLLDLNIFFKTLAVTLCRRNIYKKAAVNDPIAEININKNKNNNHEHES